MVAVALTRTPGVAADRQEDDPLWDGHCSVCGSGGDMLCCEGKVLGQGCRNVAHLACCGLSRKPRGSWFCIDCRLRREAGTAPAEMLATPVRAFKVKF